MEPDGRLCWRPSRRTNAIPARHEPESTKAPGSFRPPQTVNRPHRMDWTPPGVAACRSHPGESDQSGGGGFRPGTPRPARHANPALDSRHFPAFARRQVNQHEDGFPTPPHEKPSQLPGR